MLKEKTLGIFVFRIVGGEEIIARIVSETDNAYLITKPCQPIGAEKGIQLVPYSVLASLEQEIPLLKSSLVFIAKANDQVEEYYKKLTGESKVLVPQKSSIIV